MKKFIDLYLPDLVLVVGVLVGMQVLFAGPAERRAQERFDRVMERFDGLDERFDGVDARFDRLDASFDRLDARFDEGFDSIDRRFDRFEETMNAGFDRLEGTMNVGFDRMFERFDRLERRLRRQIDSGEVDLGTTREPVDGKQEE